MSTGNTHQEGCPVMAQIEWLQLSPVMSTGNTVLDILAMYPLQCVLQLSPVMSTGNTSSSSSTGRYRASSCN